MGGGLGLVLRKKVGNPWKFQDGFGKINCKSRGANLKKIDILNIRGCKCFLEKPVDEMEYYDRFLLRTIQDETIIDFLTWKVF